MSVDDVGEWTTMSASRSYELPGRTAPKSACPALGF